MPRLVCVFSVVVLLPWSRVATWKHDVGNAHKTLLIQGKYWLK